MAAIDTARGRLTAATATFRAVAHDATPAIFDQVTAARDAQEAAAARLVAELDEYLHRGHDRMHPAYLEAEEHAAVPHGDDRRLFELLQQERQEYEAALPAARSPRDDRRALSAVRNHNMNWPASPPRRWTWRQRKDCLDSWQRR